MVARTLCSALAVLLLFLHTSLAHQAAHLGHASRRGQKRAQQMAEERMQANERRWANDSASPDHAGYRFYNKDSASKSIVFKAVQRFSC